MAARGAVRESGQAPVAQGEAHGRNAPGAPDRRSLTRAHARAQGFASTRLVGQRRAERPVLKEDRTNQPSRRERRMRRAARAGGMSRATAMRAADSNLLYVARLPGEAVLHQ